MMEKNKGNKFITGFVWGAAIGAGLVLFFKTQKGKELLRKLKDEGIDQLTDMAEQMDEEEEFVPQHPTHHSTPVDHVNHHEPLVQEQQQEPIRILHVHTGQVDTEVDTSEHKHEASKKSSRKLFKGIGKK